MSIFVDFNAQIYTSVSVDFTTKNVNTFIVPTAQTRQYLLISRHNGRGRGKDRQLRRKTDETEEAEDKTDST